MYLMGVFIIIIIYSPSLWYRKIFLSCLQEWKTLQCPATECNPSLEITSLGRGCFDWADWNGMFTSFISMSVFYKIMVELWGTCSFSRAPWVREPMHLMNWEPDPATASSRYNRMSQRDILSYYRVVQKSCVFFDQLSISDKQTFNQPPI